MSKDDHTKRIQCLVPDLPSPSELLPYLEKMHKNRWYSNFGELSVAFELGIIDLLAKTTHDNSEQIFCCSTSSGTAALEIALSALNLEKDLNVLVPSLTFPATATSILRSSLIPLISDVCSESWQLTPKLAFELADQYDFSAVIPVATFGVSVDSDGWDRFTKQTKIPVIIDAAGAFPFQKIPKHCTVVFSFHATKAFGIGEGGAIFSKSQLSNRKHQHLSNFGFKNGVINDLGFNAKLSEYHSAVGVAQLVRWPEMLTKRRNLNRTYDELIRNNLPTVNIQKAIFSNIPSLKVIKLNVLSSFLISRLKDAGIETKKWYLPTLNQHPLFKREARTANNNINGKQNEVFSNSNQLSKHLVGLPFHNFLNTQEIQYVIEIASNSLSSMKIVNG